MFEHFTPIPTRSAESAEAHDALLREKIANAQAHALDVHTDADLIQKYADMCEAEFLPVPPVGFDMAELKSLEARVLQATARVETIGDFRNLLKHIEGLNSEERMDMIEHENAHANVAEQKDETTAFLGYGIVFFKQGDRVVSAQPITVTDRKGGGDMVRFLSDKIEILNAPSVYGHKTSDDDERESANVEEILAQYRDTRT